MKHVGMRSAVVEKLANASRLRALQFSFGDSRMLTDAPSRKTMLSEKSETPGGDPSFEIFGSRTFTPSGKRGSPQALDL
jgi:hypothetical protein